MHCLEKGIISFALIIQLTSIFSMLLCK